MKTTQSLLSAVISAGLLSTVSLANVIVSPAVPANFAAPAPASVVSPTGLPNRYIGKTVRLTMIIDAAGQPHDIKVVSHGDAALAHKLVAAVSQWQFTPARKDGAPVSTRIELPLELVES
jgi:TonB family protein